MMSISKTSDFVEIYKDLCKQHCKPIRKMKLGVDWAFVESERMHFQSSDVLFKNPCRETIISSWQFEPLLIDAHALLKIENTK
jgi:hypothetical protein